MDLTNPRWMYAKAILFVLIGLGCLALLLIDRPSLKTAALSALMVWAFARAYYFAFYVIEKYIDPGYKFSGLFAFFRYLMKKEG
ncbi:MAG: hypothetical protein JW809_01595 [Pirellulales bacterium]|nr:hypothetical protein [Pirellulales bacterium]